MSAHRLQPCPRHTPEIGRIFLAVSTWAVAVATVIGVTAFLALRFGYDLMSYLAFSLIGLMILAALLPVGILVFGQRTALSRAVRSCSVCRGVERG